MNNCLTSLLLITTTTLVLTQCVVVNEGVSTPGSADSSAVGDPGHGAPLDAQTGQGSVTIRRGGRVLSSFSTARPNVEEYHWYAGQEQIVVKSRGNHGPATVQLFESHTGRPLGSVMAYEAADGPAWARGMAE